MEDMPNSEYFSHPKPKWGEFARIKALPLWKAAALACDIDPATFEIKGQRQPREIAPFPETMADVLDKARANVGAEGILRVTPATTGKQEDAEVEMANFARWLIKMKFQPPKGFPWAAEEPDLANLDWPWGRHSTALLRRMAESANKFWKNYDSADPSTAPKNQQVVDWLISQGESENMAKAIATILRADNLPTGPRK